MSARTASALLTLAVSILSATPAEAQPDAAVTLRRFALIASSNDGGATRVQLRFANSDAESVARVLGNLGGVRPGDLVVLPNASRATLQHSFDQLKRQIANEKTPKIRRELFVYYSGHSDEDGLLLGNERVGYQELRRWIDQAGADVRIAVLDSCASGALIRLKGGVRRQAFLSDASTQARGHAFLTASSADEAAQESDRIGAAFFTHYLLTGMRGAADANHDRRVTLNEAYQYAYAETLQRTQASHAGAQHPAYDIQLAGTGDLVITDLHSSGSQLLLTRELLGRIYLRDSAGRLLVELRKEPTYYVELGLEPGAYKVVMDNDGRIYETNISLVEGGHADLALSSFAPVAPLVSTRRGSESGTPVQPPPMGPEVSAPDQYKEVKFDLVLAPGVRLSGPSDRPIRHHMVLGAIAHSDALHGMQLSLWGNIVQHEMHALQAAGAFNLTYGASHGAQFSGGVNMALGGFRGAQLSAGVNIVNGEMRGFQGSAVNLSRGHFHGLQAGAVNVNLGAQHGAQLAVVNVTQQGTQGAQIAVVNVGHGLLHGAQIGLVNVADEVQGAQIGLVNYARKNGGASIALVPWIADGYHQGGLWWSDASVANIGAKLGGHHLYIVLGAGMTRDRYTNGKRELTSTFGLGVHMVPFLGPFFIDIDAVATGFYTMGERHTTSGKDEDGLVINSRRYFADREERDVNSIRLQAGWQIAPHLALVAGPTLNVAVADASDDRVPRNVGFANWKWRSGDTVVRLYPGFVAGLQF